MSGFRLGSVFLQPLCDNTCSACCVITIIYISVKSPLYQRCSAWVVLPCRLIVVLLYIVVLVKYTYFGKHQNTIVQLALIVKIQSLLLANNPIMSQYSQLTTIVSILLIGKIQTIYSLIPSCKFPHIIVQTYCLVSAMQIRLVRLASIVTSVCLYCNQVSIVHIFQFLILLF